MTSTSLLLLVLFACIETVFCQSVQVLGRQPRNGNFPAVSVSQIIPAGLGLQGSAGENFIQAFNRRLLDALSHCGLVKAQGDLAKINAPLRHTRSVEHHLAVHQEHPVIKINHIG